MDGWASPNFEQASILCRLVDLLSPDDESSLDGLSLAIEAGWSPFLHDFIARSKGGSTTGLFFGHDEQSLGMFKRVHEGFPALIESWRLLPRLGPTQAVASRRPGKDALASPWFNLAGGQKMWLIRFFPELLEPEKILDGEAPERWMMSMAMALMPRQIGAPEPVRSQIKLDAYHGYFDSAAWSSLSSAAPKLAHRLAILLCCVAGLHPETAGWQSIAESQAIALGVQGEPAAGTLAAVIAACVAEQLARDEPERLAPMLACLGSKPEEAEALIFAQWTAKPLELQDILDRVSPWGERGLAWLFREPLRFANLFDERALAARHIKLSAGASDWPLFTLASLFKAPRCWKLLASLHETPIAMSALASHRSKLPSPLEINARMERHMAAAQAGSTESAAVLKKNLENEAARARRMLAKLPLPDALMADLLGGGGHGVPESSSEAVALWERFDTEARSLFERSCEQAHRKVKAGRLTFLKLPLAFDWMSMAMRLGARPSFFIGVAPTGSIARACSFMDHAFALGIHDYLGEAECAFVEADELALATLPRAAAPSRRGSRL